MEKGLPHNEFIAQLRGVAVLAVVLMHYGYCFPISYSSLGFVGNGYYGVALFFAISGFLITGNILQRYGAVASMNFRDFYVMRAARILPPLALAVLFLSLISATTSLQGFAFPPGLSVADAITHLVTLRFNQYYVNGAAWVMAWAVLWSISIEESFYLAYPLVALLLRREWLLVCLLLAVIAYGPLFARPNTNGLFSYFGCFDLMDMGALAAIAARRFQEGTPVAALPYIKISGAAIAVSAYLFLNVRQHFVIGPSMVALGGSLMLFSSQLEKPPSTQRSARRSMLGSIGNASYEIYLFHAAIFLLLTQVLAQTSGIFAYAILATCWAAAYAICTLIARIYSRPLNKIVRSRFSSRSNLPVSEGAIQVAPV